MKLFRTKCYGIEKETTCGFLPLEMVCFRFFARWRALRRVRQLEKAHPGHEYQLRFLGYEEEKK